MTMISLLSFGRRQALWQTAEGICWIKSGIKNARTRRSDAEGAHVFSFSTRAFVLCVSFFLFACRHLVSNSHDIVAPARMRANCRIHRRTLLSSPRGRAWLTAHEPCSLGLVEVRKHHPRNFSKQCTPSQPPALYVLLPQHHPPTRIAQYHPPHF